LNYLFVIYSNIFKSMRYRENNNCNCNNGIYFNAIELVITSRSSLEVRLSLEVMGIKDKRILMIRPARKSV